MEKKFFVDQKTLLSVLSAMQPICARRTTIDATTTILFQPGHKELILKSTDLEISLQVSCPITNSSIVTPESFLVPGKRIFDVVKELEGIIECKVHNNQLLLKAGSVNLALNIKDAQEFPPFPERIENLMQFNVEQLSTMLDKVAYLIPQNNANPALNGLFVEITKDKTTMTATDGHCLTQISTADFVLDEPRTWLLPRRAIFELRKILENANDKTIFVGVCDSLVVFSSETFNFFTKLLADPFPQYAAILDKGSFLGATIDRGSFVKTLRRAACLLSGQFIATQFSFAQATVKVSMNNKEVGTMEEQLPVVGLDDTSLDIRFYAPYLLNGLQTFDENAITFFLKNNAKPIIFESSSPHFRTLFLVMPVSPMHGV